MMKKKNLFLLIISLLMLVSACNQQNSLPADESSLEVVDLQISPALDHWLPQIADCADGIPAFGVYTRVLPVSESETETPDLLIRLGPRRDEDVHVAVLGMETITIVTGSEVPISSLSITSLQHIFSGEITNWGQVPEISEAEPNLDQPIQTLSYPDEHPLRLLFREVFLGENDISSQPIIFSTLDRINQVLEDEPYAIAYLLESQIPANANSLEITGFDPQAAQRLVLAVTQQEPQGNLRQLLLCLQDSP